MTFDKIRSIIMEQLSVGESMVTMDTNMMKDLEADSLDAVETVSYTHLLMSVIPLPLQQNRSMIRLCR